MYKQTVITIVLLVALVISALANVSYSRLQQSQAGTSQIKAASVVETQRQTKNPAIPTDASGTYRYWFWLLPLLSLPFLFLALKKRESDDLEKDLWPYKQYSVGTKGGISYGTAGDHNQEK